MNTVRMREPGALLSSSPGDSMVGLRCPGMSRQLVTPFCSLEGVRAASSKEELLHRLKS